jgi:hypothetical protein
MAAERMGRTAALRKPLAVPVPLVKPHPPPRLHHRRLNGRVGALQPEPQRGVRVPEPAHRLALEAGEMRSGLGESSGYVPGGVGVVGRGSLVWRDTQE